MLLPCTLDEGPLPPQIESEGALKDLVFPMTTVGLKSIQNSVWEKAIENYQ